MKSVDQLSFRKWLGLEAFKRIKKNQIRLHHLNYLFWECTLRCNLSCKHCGSDCRKSMSQQDMPLCDFLNAIDSMLLYIDPHHTMIVLTGGEPLLRADLEECGKALYDREFPWGIVSNGMALTKERFDALLNSGLRSITISLDGMESVHNKMRGNDRSFKQAVDAIRLIVLAGEEIESDVVTCVSSLTFPELSEIKEFLISLGVKNWRIFTIFPIGRAAANEELQLSPKLFKQLFDFIKETRKENRINLNYGCEGFLGNYESEVRDNFFFCKAGVNIGSILVDGSISACPNLRSNFIQGNIYKDNFMDTWNKKYDVFRDRSWMRRGECDGCKHFSYCQGNGMHLRDEEGNLLFCHLKRIKEGENLNKETVEG